MVVFPNCKINLGLHILQKRTDGFHNLETVFYPLPFHDGLEIIRTNSSTTQLSNTGTQIDINGNICLKAYEILRKDFPGLPPVHIHLHKNIPAGAGLGGGSADGAFTLSLLNNKLNLGLSKKQLLEYALQLGSDCPFFIINKPCYATGRGEILEEEDLDLSDYKIIIINPGIHVSTAWAFGKITPSEPLNSLKHAISLPVDQWRKKLKNDFERPVFENYPEIASIRNQLYDKGAVFASMSGSGSTVYGLFDKSLTPDFNFPPHYFMKSF